MKDELSRFALLIAANCGLRTKERSLENVQSLQLSMGQNMSKPRKSSVQHEIESDRGGTTWNILPELPDIPAGDQSYQSFDPQSVTNLARGSFDATECGYFQSITAEDRGLMHP